MKVFQLFVAEHNTRLFRAALYHLTITSSQFSET